MFSSNKRNSIMPPSPGKYSLQGLRQVYSDLLTSHAEARAAKATGRPPPVGRKEALIETIRTISEIIIYGEQNVEQELIFDYFCEKNMLALLTDMMKAPWSDESVQTQIIQTVAILVQNVCNETSLYYLLSNNYVNEIISFDMNLQNDDLISHFVSFLKTLSLRLNDRTVQFFLDDRLATFPLYDCVMRFITNVNDSMARTSALTIVLNLFRVEDPGLRAFLLRPDKQRLFFRQLGQLFQNQTSQLLGYVLSAAQVVRETSRDINQTNENQFGFDQRDAMDDVIANLQDQLFYLQDLFELGIPSLSERMGDYFVSAFVRPTLLEPIAAWHTTVLEKEKEPKDPNKPETEFDMAEAGSACVALYCLAQVFLAVKDPRVVGALLRDLFGSSSQPSSLVQAKLSRESSCEDSPPLEARRRSESMGSASTNSGSAEGSSPSKRNRFSFNNIAPPRPKGTYRAALLACLDPSRKHTPLPLLTCFMLEACVGNPGADPRVLEGLDLAPPRAPKAKKILHSLVEASPSQPIALLPVENTSGEDRPSLFQVNPNKVDDVLDPNEVVGSGKLVDSDSDSSSSIQGTLPPKIPQESAIKKLDFSDDVSSPNSDNMARKMSNMSVTSTSRTIDAGFIVGADEDNLHEIEADRRASDTIAGDKSSLSARKDATCASSSKDRSNSHSADLPTPPRFSESARSSPRSSESRRMPDRRATASFSEVELVGTLSTLIAAASAPGTPPNSSALGLVKLASRVLIALHGGGGGGFGPDIPPTTTASTGLTIGLADARRNAADQVAEALADSVIGDSVLEVMEAEVLRSVTATCRTRALPIPSPDPFPPGAEANSINVASLIPSSSALTSPITGASTHGSTHGTRNNMLLQEPQPNTAWFDLTVASTLEYDGFGAPGLSRLSNSCLLLLPHAYSSLDGGNDDRRGGAVVGGDFSGYRPNDPAGHFRWMIRLFLATTDICSTLIKSSDDGNDDTSKIQVNEGDIASPSIVDNIQTEWFTRLFLSSCLEDMYGGCGGPPPILDQSSVRLAGKQVFACMVLDGKKGPKASEPSSFLGRKPTKEISQKWFLIDPQLLLIAVPDKQSVNNGRVLSVAPLFTATAFIDPTTSKRHLTLLILSDHPIGLADVLVDVPPEYASQIVVGTRRGFKLSESSSRQPISPTPNGTGGAMGMSKWWKLVVMFETEAMCLHACEHVNSRRNALRSVRRRRLLRTIITSPPAAPPTEAI